MSKTRKISLFVALAVGAWGLALSRPASAVPFTGGFAPTVIDGRADLNGNALANGFDDANQFYGSTHIIDGHLDCNTWGTTENAGTAGDGVINAADDCTMRGFDGTADGVVITVQSGVFALRDGASYPSGARLPFVFPQPGQPTNPDIGDSKFAWSTIGGRVDANGDETIDTDDCTHGIIGRTNDSGLGNPEQGVDIVSGDPPPGSNPCGFASPPGSNNNGLVDLNEDSDITGADSCTSACFFGHNVTNGFVQAEPASTEEGPGPEGGPGPGEGPGPEGGPGPGEGPAPGPGPVVPTTTPTLNITDGGDNVSRSKDCRFVVFKSSDTTSQVSVRFSVTASNPSQIVPTSGTLIFEPLVSAMSIPVNVIKLKRRLGIVTATIFDANGAVIGDATGACTIKRKHQRRRR